jgi:hypothetical protein
VAPATLAVSVTALWFYIPHIVFHIDHISVEQPLMYLALNAGLAFIKYSECARPPGPAPG